ncbi:hypothetical protein C0J52_11604 [Blattella germanica]|nr:hypothetical protein C0J52_11604 [Blattella germanica]
MKVHTGKDIKCKFEGCIFACRSQAELRNHQQVHSEDRPYQCDTCTYSAKTKPQLVRHQTVHLLQKPHQCPHCPFSARMASHLRRHLRLHTGAKPYRCPYCSYTCNILENLRKHVLSTSKHPGKQLYECRFCDSMDAFKTNLAKDFRAHLVTSHPDHFGSAMLAASYVAGIYDANEDPKYIDKPIKIQPRWRQNKSSTATFDHDCLAKPRKEETQQLSATSTSEELNESTKEEVFDRVAHKKEKAIREPTLSMSSSVSDNIQQDQNQELLSMVVVTDPNDVIYIQIPPDPEGEAMERYCESVLFPNEGDAFLSVEHLNKRRSSGGDRSTSSNSIGCETTIMLPLGVDEVEELQEVEEIKDNEHMVVIKGNPNEQHQEGNSDEELTIIKIPPSTSGVSDFLRFPHVSHHDLGEATTSQDLERLGLHISPEVTENEHREDDPTESAEDIDPNQQEQRYVVILK